MFEIQRSYPTNKSSKTPSPLLHLIYREQSSDLTFPTPGNHTSLHYTHLPLPYQITHLSHIGWTLKKSFWWSTGVVYVPLPTWPSRLHSSVWLTRISTLITRALPHSVPTTLHTHRQILQLYSLAFHKSSTTFLITFSLSFNSFGRYHIQIIYQNFTKAHHIHLLYTTNQY